MGWTLAGRCFLPPTGVPIELAGTARPRARPITRAPPRLEATTKRIRVKLGGVVLADSRRALCLLETSHPPTDYLPLEDVDTRVLRPSRRQSFSEWKGQARFVDAVLPDRTLEALAWLYEAPEPAYQALAGQLAF